jgi:hypothetical protein
MGTASVTLANASKQPDVYPKGRAASLYCFNPDMYDENSWIKLKSTLTQAGYGSGCRLVLSYMIRDKLSIGKYVTNFGAVTDHYSKTMGFPTI